MNQLELHQMSLGGPKNVKTQQITQIFSIVTLVSEETLKKESLP